MKEIKFKIRCSAIGQIMIMPRTKKAKEAGELSATTKMYVETWLKEQLFDRKKEFSNKYTEKGLEVECDSIDFLIDNDILPFLSNKNEKFFTNEYVQGTPDVILDDEIIDVKNSWDMFSFPLFSNENQNKIYDWQLQGYMWLTNRRKARLIYILSDTPEELIEREIYFAVKGQDIIASEFNKIEQKIRKNLTFQDIENKHKIKVFNIEFDNEKIEQIKERVIACRNYINELLKKI